MRTGAAGGPGVGVDDVLPVCNLHRERASVSLGAVVGVYNDLKRSLEGDLSRLGLADDPTAPGRESLCTELRWLVEDSVGRDAADWRELLSGSTSPDEVAGRSLRSPALAPRDQRGVAAQAEREGSHPIRAGHRELVRLGAPGGPGGAYPQAGDGGPAGPRAAGDGRAGRRPRPPPLARPRIGERRPRRGPGVPLPGGLWPERSRGRGGAKRPGQGLRGGERVQVRRWGPGFCPVWVLVRARPSIESSAAS